MVHNNDLSIFWDFPTELNKYFITGIVTNVKKQNVCQQYNAADPQALSFFEEDFSFTLLAILAASCSAGR